MSDQLNIIFNKLLSQQFQLILMMLTGVILAKIGILDEKARKVLTDISFNLLLPCNIFKSYLSNAGISVLKECLILFYASTFLLIIYVLLNKFLFNAYKEENRALMKYMMLSSNSGFLGAAIAQGLYGDLGLLYNSIFMIPLRIFMWSVGLTYFTKSLSKKDIMKNVIFHPCLVALYIGLCCAILTPKVPYVLETTIKSFGNCMVPISMIITGSIISEIKLSDFIDKTSIYVTSLRVIGLPLIAFVLALALPLEKMAKSILVVMTGMPVAVVTVLFASKYGGDKEFATKCVVNSTLISMITIPMWAIVSELLLR